MSSSAASPQATGILTTWLNDLPHPLTTCIGILLLLVAISILLFGGQLIASDTAVALDEKESKAFRWLAGGPGGLIYGSVAAGTVAALLLLLALSRSGEPKIGRWAVLAAVSIPVLLGAPIGGRWQSAALLSLSLLAATSVTLLLVCSAHIALLLPRLVIFTLTLALFSVLVIWSRTSRCTVAAATSLAGAHLFCTSLDFFVKSGLIDALGLLVTRAGVIRDGSGAETVLDVAYTAKGRGLLAGWWLLAVSSCGWQAWLTHRRARQHTYSVPLSGGDMLAQECFTGIMDKASFFGCSRARQDKERVLCTTGLAHESRPADIEAFSANVPSHPFSTSAPSSPSPTLHYESPHRHTEIDLPDIVAQPARYKPWTEQDSPLPVFRSPSSLGSLPSYYTDYILEDSYASPSRSLGTSGSARKPLRGNWFERSQRWRAAAFASFRRPTVSMSRPDSSCYQAHRTTAAEVDSAQDLTVRRASMDEWWDKVVQKSEEG